jgi:hypothetical protein
MSDVTSKRKMSGQIKQFDQIEHDIWDSKGKNAVIKFFQDGLRGKNLCVIENPNEYGIDVLVLNKKDVVVAAFEIEVRYGNWVGDVKFPFSEINCIERKDYLWRKDDELYEKIPFKCAKDMNVYYVQLNDLCNRMVVISGDTVLKYDQVHWKNRKSDNEYVRQVPLKKCIEHELGK